MNGSSCITKFVSEVSVCFAFGVLSLSVLAAPPGNDLCENALVIPSSGPFPYVIPAIDISEASTNGDPVNLPGCQKLVARSIWFTFIPPETTFYTFGTCSDNTTVEDTVMAIYTGVDCSMPESFELVACADDSAGVCNRRANITTILTAGTKYYVLVWQYSQSTITPGNAAIQLVLSKTLAPLNDTCATAQVLPLGIPVYGSTIAANNDYELAGEPPFTGWPSLAVGRDVVFSFIAPADDTYSIKVFNYASDPNELVLYAASDCPQGTSLVTNYLAAVNRVLYGGAEEIMCLPLSQGQFIYIFVDEDTLTGGSEFTIEVTKCRRETEPNNTHASADALLFGIEGSINPKSDVDYYSLGTFPAGSRAFVMVDGSASPATDYTLAITTNDATWLEYDAGDNDVLYGQLSPNVAGTILPDMPVYARISKAVSRTNEPYQVYGVVQPPMEYATPESEPNDTISSANSSPNNYFRGVLTSSSDVDVFAVNVLGGDVLFISLDCDPLRDATGFDGQLQLLNADGKVLISVDNSGGVSSTNISSFSPISPGEALHFTAPDEGIYFLRVSVSPLAVDAVVNADYLLSICKNGFAGADGLDTPPMIASLAAVSIQPGQQTLLTGRIVDPDTGEAFSLNVNWGDGSPETSTNLPAGVYGLSLPHLYATAGIYTVRLSVADNSRLTNSASTSVTVGEPPRLTVSFTEGAVSIRLQGIPNVSYVLMGGPNLQEWAPAGTMTTGADGFATMVINNPGPSPLFYRAVAP